MAHRIYLVPFETDEKVLKERGFDAMPKHLKLFGRACGTISESRKMYIMKALDERDFTELESKPDVIRLDINLTRGDTRAKLQAAGIQLTPSVNEKSIQQSICKWALGEDNFDFKRLNKIHGE